MKAALSEFRLNSGTPSPATVGAAAAATDRLTSDLLVPFNKRPEKAYANPFERCHDASGFPFKTANGALTDCKPEVVYSWGSADKAELIFSGLKDKADWDIPIGAILPGKTTISAALTPVSTVFYGATPLRIKLRKNLKYVAVGGVNAWTDCSGLDPKGNKNEIYVIEKPIRTVGVTFEVAICNFKVIDSISSNTKDLYDELLRDLELVIQGKGYSYIQFAFKGKIHHMIAINFKGEPYMKKILAKGSIFNRKVVGIGDHEFQILDGREISEKTLAANLRDFRDSVLTRNEKFTSSSPGTKLEDHMRSDEPLPFN